MELLRANAIEVVADVRSIPRSGYSPHFDRVPLERALGEQGVRYVFMGEELGGRPTDDSYYDEEGHVRYDLVANSTSFLAGIDRLMTGTETCRVAMMCSEENPSDCHRRLLVGRVIAARGVPLHHIRGTDAGEIEGEVVLPVQPQASLFGEEPPRWRSTRSISPDSSLSGTPESVV